MKIKFFFPILSPELPVRVQFYIGLPRNGVVQKIPRFLVSSTIGMEIRRVNPVIPFVLAGKLSEEINVVYSLLLGKCPKRFVHLC